MRFFDWLLGRTKPTPPAASRNPNPPIPRGRICTHLIVLGGGFQPGSEGHQLALQFKSSNPLINFGVAELHMTSMPTWSESNKTTLGSSVIATLMMWFPMNLGIAFDPSDGRLQYNDYYDNLTGKGYVVAAYIP